MKNGFFPEIGHNDIGGFEGVCFVSKLFGGGIERLWTSNSRLLGTSEGVNLVPQAPEDWQTNLEDATST